MTRTSLVRLQLRDFLFVAFTLALLGFAVLCPLSEALAEHECESKLLPDFQQKFRVRLKWVSVWGGPYREFTFVAIAQDSVLVKTGFRVGDAPYAPHESGSRVICSAANAAQNGYEARVPVLNVYERQELHRKFGSPLPNVELRWVSVPASDVPGRVR